jgi:hypothetical protein
MEDDLNGVSEPFGGVSLWEVIKWCLWQGVTCVWKMTGVSYGTSFQTRTKRALLQERRADSTTLQSRPGNHRAIGDKIQYNVFNIIANTFFSSLSHANLRS